MWFIIGYSIYYKIATRSLDFYFVMLSPLVIYVSPIRQETRNFYKEFFGRGTQLFIESMTHLIGLT